MHIGDEVALADAHACLLRVESRNGVVYFAFESGVGVDVRFEERVNFAFGNIGVAAFGDGHGFFDEVADVFFGHF